jgi:UDP-glucose 4-epimerase
MGIEPAILLITGGCGFIGKNLIDFMLKKGFTNFRILDNLSVGTTDDLENVLSTYGKFEKIKVENRIVYAMSDTGSAVGNTMIELQIGDIRNIDDCLRSSENAGAVVHLAAQSGVPVSVENPLLDCDLNIKGTLNMLEACRKNKVSSFIFASSGAPLGEVEPPIHEEKVPRPVSPYGASKLAGEAYCSAYYKTFGINTVVLRFGNVYGPGSKHKTSVVAKFMKNAIEGLPLEIYGDGTQTRDFIFIEDLCNAIYLSLKAIGISDNGAKPSGINFPAAGEIFQIATFKETTVGEIAEKIKYLIEDQTAPKVSVIHSEKRTGDVQRNYSDISKAIKILGFKPEYDLDRGLYETWQFYEYLYKSAINHKTIAE